MGRHPIRDGLRWLSSVGLWRICLIQPEFSRSLLKRGGKVYAAIIPNAQASTLIPIIREKVRPTASFIQTVFKCTMCWMFRSFTTGVSTTARCLSANAALTSTGLKTFGTKPIGICAGSTASPRTALTGS